MSSIANNPETWLDEHGDALYRFALVRLRNPHKAEEAVQETLLAGLQARDQYAESAKVRTWLIGILKHKIVDQFRRDARELALDDEGIDPDDIGREMEDSFSSSGRWAARLADWGSPDATLENEQFWRILQQCMDGLPERLRQLFYLRELMEESTDSICHELDISASNLWTMLYRARMGLRKCLEHHWARR